LSELRTQLNSGRHGVDVCDDIWFRAEEPKIAIPSIAWMARGCLDPGHQRFSQRDIELYQVLMITDPSLLFLHA
jgi:hypothetical protein